MISLFTFKRPIGIPYTNVSALPERLLPGCSEWDKRTFSLADRGKGCCPKRGSSPCPRDGITHMKIVTLDILTWLLRLGAETSKSQASSQASPKASACCCPKASPKAKTFVLGCTKQPLEGEKWHNSARRAHFLLSKQEHTLISTIEMYQN